MRIAAFKGSAGEGLGLVEAGEVSVLHEGPVGSAGVALLKLIEGGAAALQEAQAKAADARKLPLAEVTLLPPAVSRRAAVICVGKNYHAHAREFFGSGFDSTGKDEIPPEPVIFSKAGSSLIGHGAAIHGSLDPTQTVDYEGELALIIGKPAHKVTRDNAFDVIFGYTICNDVTSRELQKRHNQWLVGKSLDTFGPLGPWIVTADEMGDITRQTLTTTVNGEERQRAPISDLIFDIPGLIETLSATMTLQPGDIIATGTPAGVGIGHTPPKYLVPGDKVDVTISGIGTLSNPVV
ncbi:fumarylacetoacetate hydrolase family protein [Roseibaca sp. Y0-43]|uniref:fumarylacetoacetate hydrolase family protein n=1 Tax=Roseibaca sp. Y0-43 TaxID=2816854 RepID=UPI001D0C5599|nr:fumarylacetoacetate hydrolase family protein [Roseibaca sp. Y0-43]MCC1481157.1 fumarylacetoacetate hydrolase family protein [Roseibaca sp. Y0-43]